MLPCPPLLLDVLLWRTGGAMPSRRLSRALKLLDTAILALVSLAESTLELPKRRPHLLARALRPDGGPDDGDGEGVDEATVIAVSIRASSVSVNLAGNYLPTHTRTYHRHHAIYMHFICKKNTCFTYRKKRKGYGMNIMKEIQPFTLYTQVNSSDVIAIFI